MSNTRTSTMMAKLAEIRNQMKARLEDATKRRDEAEAEIADLKRVIKSAEAAERHLKEA